MKDFEEKRSKLVKKVIKSFLKNGLVTTDVNLYQYKYIYDLIEDYIEYHYDKFQIKNLPTIKECFRMVNEIDPIFCQLASGKASIEEVVRLYVDMHFIGMVIEDSPMGNNQLQYHFERFQNDLWFFESTRDFTPIVLVK